MCVFRFSMGWFWRCCFLLVIVDFVEGVRVLVVA